MQHVQIHHLKNKALPKIVISLLT